jgi:hypothetical protein
MQKVVSKNISTFGDLSSSTPGFQPMPMPKLQDFEERLLKNFKKTGN